MNKLKQIKPPLCKRVDHEISAHGHKRNDPYYWLRCDTRDDPEVLAYLEAENSYANEKLRHLLPKKQEIYNEIVRRSNTDEVSTPIYKHGYWYFSRLRKGAEHPEIRRTKSKPAVGTLGKSTIILDLAIRAQGHKFYTLSTYHVRSDARIMAFAEDYSGRWLYTLSFKDLKTGRILQDKIEDVSSFQFAGDDLYYVKKHPVTLNPYQVYRHKIGTDCTFDTLCYEEKDETFKLRLEESDSGEYLFLLALSYSCTEYHLMHIEDPDAGFKVFCDRRQSHRYKLQHAKRGFFALSNIKHENFALYAIDDTHRNNPLNWREVYAGAAGIYMHKVVVLAKYFAIEEQYHGSEAIDIRDENGNSIHLICFPQKTCCLALDCQSGKHYKENTLRYTYQSMHEAPRVYELKINTLRETLLTKPPVVGIDSKDYISEQLMVKAKDGIDIPVSLMRRKNTTPGPKPILLYGYGAYGRMIAPDFRIEALSLCDRGFIFAIAHIRGGEELGPSWYEDGKLLKKKNTFADFVSVTEHLICEKIADPKNIFALGTSAGGMLMGVIANEFPHLYRGILMQVPFVDVLTTMLDPSIPLTTSEYNEWGNPKDKTYYDYILSYSPYDQIKNQVYPHMIVTAALHDSQVQYFEPAKWVAKLRHTQKPGSDLFLLTDMHSSHRGKSGRFGVFKDIAFLWAFILQLVQKTGLI